MNGHLPTSIVLTLCLSFSAAACSKQPPALYASSAGQGPYALQYPESLSGLRTEIATVESQVGKAETEFQTYPDALSNPNWPDVLVVYSAADESGKTAAYVEELERSEVVARFYVDEKDELNRRVGGAAQQAAKKKECDVELYGPTTYALGKGIEERLRDRLRAHSEAQQYLTDHEEALGKRNRPKLEDQIDAIGRASYLAHVAFPKLRERLSHQANEASQVKNTLKRVAEDAHRVAADPKTSAALRTKATEREQAATAAGARIDAEANDAKKLSDEMEKRGTALRDKYEAAIKALKKSVEDRAKAH
jgi:hypothetical protein